MGIVTDLIYIVLAALVGGLVAHVLRQPLIFGYILAGIAVGPYTGGVTVRQIDDIRMLAEIGVALLLFSIGLELSFAELKRLIKVSFLATPLQVIACSLGGGLLAMRMGIPGGEAVWFGSAVSLSSTMVVIKLLQARGILDTPIGKLGVAVLVAQDLAVVPMLILLPQLAHEGGGAGEVLAAVGTSVACLGAIILVGAKVLPRLFAAIASRGSRELLFLAVLAVVFGAGALFHAMGFSFALGAFVAGMLLSGTRYCHQAMTDVGGLRDLFALIFFASLGMLFDPRFFVDHLITILALTGGVVALKALITAGILRLFGYPPAFALGAGFGLSQVGEFAFVVAGVGVSQGTVSDQTFSLLLATALLSMAVTPAMLYIASFWYRRALGAAESANRSLAQPA